MIWSTIWSAASSSGPRMDRMDRINDHPARYLVHRIPQAQRRITWTGPDGPDDHTLKDHRERGSGALVRARRRARGLPGERIGNHLVHLVHLVRGAEVDR